MIRALFGENSFAITRELEKVIAGFDGVAEKYDAEALTVKQLPDLFMAVTLFAEKRLVIIKNIAENSSLWSALADWLPRVSADIDLILVDAKPDKRTTTYKAIKNLATVQEFPVWTERDTAAAQRWVVEEAAQRGVKLDSALGKYIVERVGADQWQLAGVIEKAALLEAVNKETIDTITDARPQDNVFSLFELALGGKRGELARQIRSLELHEDPHRLFALLSSQAFQLAVVHSAKPEDDPVKDFGIHPFVASKLRQQAKYFTAREAAHILTLFADADRDMKQSRGEPWLVIEKTLLAVAQ